MFNAVVFRVSPPINGAEINPKSYYSIVIKLSKSEPLLMLAQTLFKLLLLLPDHYFGSNILPTKSAQRDFWQKLSRQPFMTYNFLSTFLGLYTVLASVVVQLIYI